MADITQQHQAFALKGHIQRGDVAPWWNQGRYKFAFDPVGGRYIVLGFYQTARDFVGRGALSALNDHRRLVEEEKVAFFCISSDRKDHEELKLDRDFSSLEFLWDFDATINRAYGIGSSRLWIVLDPMLRVLEVIPFRPDGSDKQQLFDILDKLPSPSCFLGFEAPTPTLILPHVFEPEFSSHLINTFKQCGGRESGFMREEDGRPAEIFDPEWKRRKDYAVTSKALIEQITARMSRRVGGMLQKAFHFKVTRMERYLIACYSAEDGGHFGPHRDDTVKATEHRRFAVSINLNDDFDGGELSFPEFSSRRYKAPIGAALVFSSSLLHRVSKVTRGRRYAFLPFLHNEEAEKHRQTNLNSLARPT
jgi:predicted 2-oxoglutarate/Fe(II)-dependent dioxygenase YbiX/peroxiredoxin